ncbi:hypothetical protein PIB30_038660 [Stylosanthes scabra]|uniref:Uncharacterized protein n=1 Tax=Stylosanthes scabra TaxID=79078 RepID=A0ABU6XBU5_9FABA|nr:hypothetical protein [Stylosanthes scabra]
MNKTSEEAMEMIETVADANQHFSTRAKSKGVCEIAPSESTMLAKSLVDIVAMLKEIKEGQHGGRMNNKTSGVHLSRTNQDSPIVSRETTRTPDISLLTTVNNTLQ